MTVLRNLYDLLIMRSIAILAQILIIFVIHTQLGLELPLAALSGIISLQTVFNLLSWWQVKKARHVSDFAFFLQLLSDVAALTALLYFTGGATNPFTWIYLLPLMIVTINLPRLYAWSMALIAIAAYSLLMIWYVPLAGTHMQHDSGFGQHIIGMWGGFVFSALLMVHFVSLMAHNLRERDQALAQAREKALRDERLIALATLAAGAAHELGTPLGTLSVLSKELLNDYPAAKDADLHAQLQILHSQTDRCKQVLSLISASSGANQAMAGRRMSVAAFLDNILSQWQSRRPAIRLQTDYPQKATPEQILADETLRQALFSVLDNAADASPQDVCLQAHWDEQQLHIQVLDRGSGLHTALSAGIDQPLTSSKEHGLGLGLFLAHAAVQRLGGQVLLSDREDGGLCCEINLPLFAHKPQ
ncbi:MAG: sensor histidine kinase [gamma proteobacterium symbiont of Bathyaustriella thionipta]|nr:sensor histidine kinase [gamma proteobacterium symbiont of Bathyaustriella thionipta]